MRARVVDTSVLVSASRSDDANHAQAHALLREQGPAVVPNEVVVETLGVLRSKVDREAARRFLDALRATEGIELAHDSDFAAALDLCDKEPALSIVDAVGITMAWRLGCDLDTFDLRQRAVWRRSGRPRKSTKR